MGGWCALNGLLRSVGDVCTLVRRLGRVGLYTQCARKQGGWGTGVCAKWALSARDRGMREGWGGLSGQGGGSTSVTQTRIGYRMGVVHTRRTQAAAGGPCTMRARRAEVVCARCAQRGIHRHSGGYQHDTHARGQVGEGVCIMRRTCGRGVGARGAGVRRGRAGWWEVDTQYMRGRGAGGMRTTRMQAGWVGYERAQGGGYRPLPSRVYLPPPCARRSRSPTLSARDARTRGASVLDVHARREGQYVKCARREGQGGCDTWGGRTRRKGGRPATRAQGGFGTRRMCREVPCSVYRLGAGRVRTRRACREGWNMTRSPSPRTPTKPLPPGDTDPGSVPYLFFLGDFVESTRHWGGDWHQPQTINPFRPPARKAQKLPKHKPKLHTRVPMRVGLIICHHNVPLVLHEACRITRGFAGGQNGGICAQLRRATSPFGFPFHVPFRSRALGIAP